MGRGRAIKQIRFINGTEAVMNIVEWDEDVVLANNILVMEPYHEIEDESKSYYLLKPLVSYTDDLGAISQLNAGSMMAISEPSQTVLNQYNSSIREIVSQMEDDEMEERGVSKGNVFTFDSRKRILTED